MGPNDVFPRFFSHHVYGYSLNRCVVGAVACVAQVLYQELAMERELAGVRGSHGGPARSRRNEKEGYAAHAADSSYRKSGVESSGSSGKESQRIREEFKDYAEALRKRDRRGRDSGAMEARGGRSYRDPRAERDHVKASFLQKRACFFVCACFLAVPCHGYSIE